MFHSHFLSGCHSTELVLSCPPGNLMVIHSALFSPAPGPSLNCSHHTAHSSALTSDNGLTSGAPPGTAHAHTDIRQAVTRRCSGYSRGEDCKFSLLLDVAESEVWGGE